MLLKHEKGAPKKEEKDYRHLAQKCREAAGKVSAEQERASLLSMATKWDLVADYFQQHPRNSMNRLAHWR
jgi:hypothetical protein